jgi:hypothetical protein
MLNLTKQQKLNCNIISIMVEKYNPPLSKKEIVPMILLYFLTPEVLTGWMLRSRSSGMWRLVFGNVLQESAVDSSVAFGTFQYQSVVPLTFVSFLGHLL